MAVRGPDDLERAFSSLKEAQVDGLLVEQSPVFIFQAKTLAELAADAARYIGKILKGANPVDLPVEGSEKTFLTVNSKAAKGLGIAVPPQVQARANSIIE